MAHTHEHDCRLCGEHFDSSEELARHNEKTHQASASTPSGESKAPDLRDRNPGQGFRDPRADRSDAT